MKTILKKLLQAVLIISTLMISCKKADFVPVIYEWFPIGSEINLDYFDIDYINQAEMNMFFFNAKTGFIAVSRPGYPDFNLFCGTDDSCRSFQDPGGPISLKVREMTFISDSVMYFMGEFNYQTVVSRSFDGGKEWEDIDIPPSVYFSDIASNPIGNVFLISQDSRLMFYSEDDGETWTEQFSVKDTSAKGHTGLQIQFTGAGQDTGFVNFMDTLYMTTNGGNSWNAYLYNHEHGFERFQFLDISTVYVHYDDQFMKSRDGGRTFDTVSYLQDFYSWKMLSEKEAYCWNLFVIYHSLDEFRTRARMDFFRTADDRSSDYTPKGYVITGSDEGYAVTTSGKLYEIDRAPD